MEKNNFSSNINLLKLKGAFMTKIQGKTGEKACLVIPVTDADLYLKLDDNMEVKGVHLSLAHWENSQPGKYGDTHMIKQSHSKDWSENHSEEEKRQEPILGNSRPMMGRQQQASQQPGLSTTKIVAGDDLPF